MTASNRLNCKMYFVQGTVGSLNIDLNVENVDECTVCLSKYSKHRRSLIRLIFPTNEKPPSAKSHVTEAKIEDQLELDF